MANLNLQDKKFITPENLRLIINYGLGFASRVKKLEDKEIAPFEADKLYTKDSLTIYDGYIYKAKVTNQSSTFNEIYWDLIGDDITELTKSDVEAMVGLSAEEIETLSKIILDSEVRLDKTFSSSKIYTDIQNAIQTSKDYTLTELSKMSGASYKVVTSTSEMINESIIYLLPNATNYDMYIVEEGGTTTKIGDTAINLDNYFTKTEITDNYYDKVTCDGKFATITTVDTHISDTVAHVTQAEKDSYVKKTDIVDNLTSTDTNKPLSANQGKALKDELDMKVNITDIINKTSISTTLDETSTDDTVPTSRVVYDAIEFLKGLLVDIKPIMTYTFTSGHPVLPQLNDTDTYKYTFEDSENGNGTTTRNLYGTTPVTSISFYNRTNSEYLVSLNNTAKIRLTSMNYMFRGCTRLTSVNLKNIDTTNVKGMAGMFYDCRTLDSVNLSSFNTANVTIMYDMFANCYGLTSVNLSSFNTAKVTNMSYMFHGCNGLTSVNLSSFNTAKVTNMSYMFNDCNGLTSLRLTNFSSASLINTSNMFTSVPSSCKIYRNSSNFTKTESETGFSGTFKNV